jgi:hypothetical protein
MQFKNKYNKYNDKFMDITGGYNSERTSETNSDFSNNEYQEIIYKIAKYIKPNTSHKFKKDFGMKQLSNQVIELNKSTFLSELQNNITNYYMTDKIDGKRTILYLSNDNNASYAVSDILTPLDIKTKDICILDTEMYEGDYYIFDVMVYEGENLVNTPFEERMKYFDKFKNIPKIKTKSFIKLDNNYKKQIKKFKEEKKNYEVDGIIFTPEKENYNEMKVYKYKPPDQLTIDFLIKRCPDKDKNNSYFLFCGISKRVFYKLKMKFIKCYEDIFPEINTKNLPHYFPIQFQPSSYKKAYIFSNSDNKNLDGKVGEFLYNIETKEWTLKKIREDRKIEVERGNYFGNNYKIAEFIWMALFDPLIIGEKEETQDANQDTYFQEHDNVLQKASRSFNSYVKSELFKKFQGTEWVMDLASGKGQDLFRYSTFGMKNVVFLEIDKVALTELINRKHIFANDDKFRNSMNVLIQNTDLLDNYKMNIKKIKNVYKKKKDIDLIICNFALHYFMKDKQSLKNICKLINHYLKAGGKFVFTAFDGQKIMNLLEKNNGEWIIKDKGQIKYGIKRKYKKDKLISVGQKIDVLLPFSKNSFYEEYLVNINSIAKKLKKYDIILETNNSFSSHIDSYRGYLDYNDKTYVDLYHYYIFVKK